MWKFAPVALLVLGDVGAIESKAVETNERGKQLDGSP